MLPNRQEQFDGQDNHEHQSRRIHTRNQLAPYRPEAHEYQPRENAVSELNRLRTAVYSLVVVVVLLTLLNVFQSQVIAQQRAEIRALFNSLEIKSQGGLS